ncbi:MAG: hypothetical protein KatS3mg105_5057 [Gemmatales bacterium]|nr:MAG: hypothetical protein KatS3mg105_5057 [Gemmatales bacterium]
MKQFHGKTDTAPSHRAGAKTYARRRQALRFMVLLAVGLLVRVSPATLRADGPATTSNVSGMRIVPANGSAISTSTPVTFGAVFRDGEIPAGKAVVVRVDGRKVDAQVDAKKRFADGSLKHAIVSLVLPSLKAEGAALSFAPADAPRVTPAVAAADAAKKLLAGDFDAVVSYKVPEGRTVTASARRMLEAALAAPSVTQPDRPAGSGTLWLNGQVATEWLLSAPPTDDAGHADPDLLTRFYVRYYPAARLARVSAVTEICGNHGSDGGLIYDVRIASGRSKPAVAFEQPAVAQPDLTRWRKVFWVGAAGAPEEVVVRYDPRQLAAAGVVPKYDFDLDVTPALNDLQKKWQQARTHTGLFQSGMITAYMPTTGGRPDIGLLPWWTTVYVMTQDAGAREAILENDELSGGIPIHARDCETGRVPFYRDHPKLWLCDGRAGRWGTEKWRSKPAPARVDKPVESIFRPDPAHLPSLAYVPYLITGDFYDLEENWFWSNYVLYYDNPGYAKGFLHGQLRGIAWGLRTVALTAGISPDGLPETTEFEQRTIASLKHFHELLDQKVMPLGMLSPHHSNGITNYAPWQHDYLIMSVDAAANAGFDDAVTLRERLLKFSLGRFTHAPDFAPDCGCGYWWTVGTVKDGITVHTWRQLYAMNHPDGKKPKWQDFAGGYADLALAAAAIGVRTGQPDAKTVFTFLQDKSPQLLAGRSRNPVFALTPVPMR